MRRLTAHSFRLTAGDGGELRAVSRCRIPPALVRLLTVNIGREVRNMLYLVRALVYLLEMALAASGVTMTLTAEALPPSDGTLLGSAPALSQPIRTLKLTRGSGPSLVTFWKGYWNLTP